MVCLFGISELLTVVIKDINKKMTLVTIRSFIVIFTAICIYSTAISSNEKLDFYKDIARDGCSDAFTNLRFEITNYRIQTYIISRQFFVAFLMFGCLCIEWAFYLCCCCK